MNKSGIYLIRNTANGKVYVGSTCSSYGFNRRWNSHKCFLRKNKHQNRHLQNAWNKYGASSFEFTILELCNDNMLEIREQAWINYYDSMNHDKGYNLCRPDRYKLTEEHKKRIGIASKKVPRTKEWNNNISKGLCGKKKSKEHINNMKVAKSGTGYDHKNILMLRNMSINNKKPVSQYSKDGKIINSFSSAKDASIYFKKINPKASATFITHSIKHNKTAYGYIFKYSNTGDVHKPA